jgi:hypothetical protein
VWGRPDLAAKVVEGLSEGASGPDPETLARIERDREAAMARYRRDRNTRGLDEAMARLDVEEVAAHERTDDGPTAAEAADRLRDLPKLWDDADGSGRRLHLEALFERLEVLGVRKLRIRPTPTTVRYGWADAWNGAKLLVMVGARGIAPSCLTLAWWSGLSAKPSPGSTLTRLDGSANPRRSEPPSRPPSVVRCAYLRSVRCGAGGQIGQAARRTRAACRLRDPGQAREPTASD